MKELKTIIEVKRCSSGIFIEESNKLAQENANLLNSAINSFETGFNKVFLTACKKYYEYDTPNESRFLIFRRINNVKYY